MDTYHTLRTHTHNRILFSAKGQAGSGAAGRIKGSAAKKGWLPGNATSLCQGETRQEGSGRGPVGEPGTSRLAGSVHEAQEREVPKEKLLLAAGR